MPGINPSDPGASQAIVETVTLSPVVTWRAVLREGFQTHLDLMSRRKAVLENTIIPISGINANAIGQFDENLFAKVISSS